MVVTRVFGNDATVGFAGTQGNFQLNVFTPVMAHAVLETIRLLADASRSFTEHCVGLEPDRERIAANLRRPDARHRAGAARRLRPRGGIAKQAHRDGSTLREAAVAVSSGAVTPDQFDQWVVPADMTHPAPAT